MQNKQFHFVLPPFLTPGTQVIDERFVSDGITLIG
jgi:hypothetical protein